MPNPEEAGCKYNLHYQLKDDVTGTIYANRRLPSGISRQQKELIGGLDWWKRDGYATEGDES